MILFSRVSISAVGPTKNFIKGEQGALSRYIKRSGLQANNSLQSAASIKMLGTKFLSPKCR
jgi:hypothetical protein